MTGCCLSEMSCRMVLLIAVFFAPFPTIFTACSVRENRKRRGSKTELPSPRRPSRQSRPLKSTMRSKRLSVAVFHGPAAMTISSFETLCAHASMTADDICVLPVPGGPRTSTSLCLPVMVMACWWPLFKLALQLALSKSRSVGGCTYMHGRTQQSAHASPLSVSCPI